MVLACARQQLFCSGSAVLVISTTEKALSFLQSLPAIIAATSAVQLDGPD